MASYQFVLYAEGAANPANLVLEEGAQRLDDAQIHFLRQTAHIVVGLDLAGGAVDSGGLYDIRVYGSLGEPARVFYATGISVESLDEEAAYDLALLLRVADAGEGGKELR